MNITRRQILAVGAALLPLPGFAKSYPEKIIHLICPFAAGGAADASARQLATAMTAALGQPVVVENRPGGGGTLAAQTVARSAPDGYTLLFGTIGPQIVNPHIMRSLPYDPVKDLAPISGYKRAPNVLVVHPSIPAKSVSELMEFARRNPGKLTYASAGVGSSSHLAGAELAYLGKVEIRHVPYRGTSAALVDLFNGEVSMSLDALSILMPHVKAGKLRALAVTTTQRTKLAPQLPPIAETLPGYDASALNYVATTAGTPADVIARLNEVIVGILKGEDYRKRMEELGEEPMPTSSAELANFIVNESARWKKVIDAANIRVD